MKHVAFLALSLALIVGGLAQSVAAEPVASSQAALKVVVHINFDDSDRQKHGLKNVANMLEEDPRAEIEVVCHGKGLSLLKSGSAHSAEIAKLAKAQVKFAACQNTMREQGVTASELLPGVITVPSGVVEVARKQQQGFSYLKP